MTKPTILSWAPNRLDALVVGGDDHRIYHRYLEGQEWAGQKGDVPGKWQGVAPEELAGRISAVSWGVNRIDMFAREEGSNDCLWLFYDPTRSDTLNGWGPKKNGAVHWECIGGPLKTEPTGLTLGMKDRVEVFAVFEDGNVYKTNWSASSGWAQPWTPLPEAAGRVLASRPSVVLWGGPRMDIVARTAEKDVVHIAFDPSLGGWQKKDGNYRWEWGPRPKGVELKGGPTAVSRAPGRLDVFAQGTDNELWWKSWRPGWSGWSYLDMGGRNRGEIAAVAPTSESLCVLVFGRDEFAIHAKRGFVA